MVQRCHHHIQAIREVGRKLAARVWATLEAGQPYQLRDVDNQPLDTKTAAALAATFTVPEYIRARARARARSAGANGAPVGLSGTRWGPGRPQAARRAWP